MMWKTNHIVNRFTLIIFSAFALLGFLFILLTWLGFNQYHEAGVQLLNKDVASHIAKFTSPYTGKGINKAKADSVFYNAMVLNPGSEVYFLDTSGNIIAFHGDKAEILDWQIPLEPIQKYLNDGGDGYIKNLDPKDLSTGKVFSASPVLDKNKKLGYIYVILDSKKSESHISILLSNHIIQLILQGFLVVFIFSLIFVFISIRRINKNFRQTENVLNRFEHGDYSARFSGKQDPEMAPVAHAFNKMADLLSHSIQTLTESDDERKRFIANISHDLRTPLAIARGYAETLLLGNKSHIERNEDQPLSLMHGKILQIEKMVKQLFELSKIDAAQFTPNKEPFVLSEIVQETVNNFQNLANAKHVNIQCVQCLYHVWVNADISMTERVIQNLIENAINNTPENGRIATSLEVQDGMLIFHIENTGLPLAEPLVYWINDQRPGKYILREQPAGIGLGLLIVQRILQLHGSHLETARKGEFNAFQFSLPIFN